jgi:hypothetical protein
MNRAVREGTEDGRQGAEPRDRGQRTGDKEERHKTEDLGWETKYNEGTKDVRQGREKGTEEWVT